MPFHVRMLDGVNGAPLRLFVILACLLAPSSLLATPAYQVGTTPLSLSDFDLEVAFDPSLERDIQAIANGALPWLKQSSRIHGNGQVGHYWLRLGLENDSSNPVERLLHLDETWVADLRLYWRDATGWQERRTGLDAAINKRDLYSHLNGFRLTLAPGERRNLYLRLFIPTAHWSIGLHLKDPQQFSAMSLDFGMGFALFVGAILSLIAYNLFIYLSLRDPLYLYYLLYAASFLLFVVIFNGIYLYLFTLSEPGYARMSMSSSLFMIFFILFVRRLLETRRHLPRLDLILRGVTAYLMLLSLLIVIDHHRFYLLVMVTSVPILLLMLGTGIFAAVKRIRYAGFYLFAFSWYLAGLSLLVLLNLQLLSYSPFIRFANLGGALIEITAFSLVLAWRVRDLQRERSAYQQRLLTMESEAKQQLEQQVKERTSELSVAVAEAKQANRAKGDFLANMSHEIRTPMHVIMGMARLSLDQPLGKTARRYVWNLLQAAESLLGLINDVLDVSRIEANRLRLEQIDFSLTEVLEQLRRMVDLRAEEKGLDFSIERAPEVPEFLHGDPLRLGQILLNLCSNAVKFTSTGSVRVHIDLTTDEGEGPLLWFSVEDSGIGIPADQQACLFDSFTQADTSVSRRFGGTGLGLAICKQLAELMAGTIDLHSKPGVGSRFRLCLPLQPARGKPVALPGSDDWQGLHGKRILLVDDSSLNLEISAGLLQRHGLKTTSVQSGAAALASLQKCPCDAVLMDCQMPDLDGYQTTRMIRALPGLAELPVIALTASAMPAEREKALAAGMNEHISKPYRPERLLAILAKWITPDQARMASTGQQSVLLPPALAAESFDSFCLDQGVEFFSGDIALYLQQLEKFLHLYTDFPRQFENARNDPDSEGARNLAHQLKGNAGLLKLIPLSDLAATLEQADDQDRDLSALVSCIDRALDQCAQEVARARLLLEDTQPDRTTTEP